MRKPPRQIERSRELRQMATTAEAILWRALRNRRFAEIKFRRQQPIGPFIVDFFCARLKLVIELDGDSHLGREAYDARRQARLEADGLRVIRIFNVDVHENLEGVMERIDRECQARTPSPAPQPTP